MDTASMYGVGDFLILFAANSKIPPAAAPLAASEKILRHGGICKKDDTAPSPSAPVRVSRIRRVANWNASAMAAESIPAKTA